MIEKTFCIRGAEFELLVRSQSMEELAIASGESLSELDMSEVHMMMYGMTKKGMLTVDEDEMFNVTEEYREIADAVIDADEILRVQNSSFSEDVKVFYINSKEDNVMLVKPALNRPGYIKIGFCAGSEMFYEVFEDFDETDEIRLDADEVLSVLLQENFSEENEEMMTLSRLRARGLDIVSQMQVVRIFKDYVILGKEPAVLNKALFDAWADEKPRTEVKK